MPHAAAAEARQECGFFGVEAGGLYRQGRARPGLAALVLPPSLDQVSMTPVVR
jgi:hypothetical protein